MSMRISEAAYPGEGRGPEALERGWTLAFAGVFLLLLSACGSGGPDNSLPGGGGDKIECMVAGETAFQRSCDVERLRTDKGELVLTVRHPSGGFRRLMVTTDGRGVIAADGAEPAVVKVIDGKRIEVTIAGDAYRLPATVKTP